MISGHAVYSSIEIPLGIRCYFFLRDRSKLFVDACYVQSFSFNSSIEIISGEGSLLHSLEMAPINGHLVTGLGFKYNDKLSLEFRLRIMREILNHYQYWTSIYNPYSLIFGYTLF
jgi:hypothetical protein